MARRWGSILLLILGCPALGRGSDGPEALSAAFRTAARKVLPAVVRVKGSGGVPRMSPLPGVPDSESVTMPGRDPAPDMGGSGVVVDAARGWILTNDHVVADVPRLVVTLADGRERVVRDVRRDPRGDLALLSIDPEGLVAADWGDSETLDLGDWVLAVGQPFGLSGTVTAGIVSGERRSLDVGGYHDLIQTSAAINPGSSGGPLIDLKGRIVGINVGIKTVSGGYEGVGFAVPAARARRIAADLAERGQVRRMALGISGEPFRGDTPGVRVTSVVPDSPASAADLRPGDLLIQIGPRPIKSIGAIRAAVEFAPDDPPLPITLLRDGARIQTAVRLVPATEK